MPRSETKAGKIVCAGHPGKAIRRTEVTTEQVQMDVKDFLARVGPTVQDEPVSRLVDPLVLSELDGHPCCVAMMRLPVTPPR